VKIGLFTFVESSRGVTAILEEGWKLGLPPDLPVVELTLFD
jgi:hypothetical protein